MLKLGALGIYELFVLLGLLLLMLLPLLLFWRVFQRTGLAPALALLCLVPGIGFLLALTVLAVSSWPATMEHRVRTDQAT